MARYINDIVLNQALNYIKNNADKVIVSSVDSTDYATVTTAGNILGQADLVSGDFALGDGASSGRDVAFLGKTNVVAGQAGRFKQIAILDTSSTNILAVYNAKQERDIQVGDTLTIDENTYTITDAL